MFTLCASVLALLLFSFFHSSRSYFSFIFFVAFTTFSLLTCSFTFHFHLSFILFMCISLLTSLITERLNFSFLRQNLTKEFSFHANKLSKLRILLSMHYSISGSCQKIGIKTWIGNGMLQFHNLFWHIWKLRPVKIQVLHSNWYYSKAWRKGGSPFSKYDTYLIWVRIQELR